jgi:hypothetical protein
MREYEKFKYMSYRQLKNELLRCSDNPHKERIIREVMKDKAIRYKLRKREISNSKNINYANIEFSSDEDIVGTILNDIDNTSYNSNNNSSYDSDIKKIDPIYKEEIEKDFVNNSLMDRMNSELDLRSIRNRNRNNKNKNNKEFMSPFEDSVGDNYAPFSSKKKINNFSNKRFL